MIRTRIRLISICLVSMVAVWVFGAVIKPPSGTVTASWDYPVQDLSTDLVFRVYYQTGGMFLTPLTNWPLATQVVAQLDVTNYSVKLPWPDPVQATFSLTASNKNGESFFSDTDYMPGAVRTNQPFRIGTD